MLQLTIDTSVRERWSGAVLAYCWLDGCDNRTPLGIAFEEERALVLSELRSRGKAVLEEPRLQQMRATFRAMPDMDPTRYRPATESLIRRCLEKDLFRISPLVDVNNLTSMQVRAPLGIYDLDRLASRSWIYRIGVAGEKYRTISGQEKSAEGKLVLADSKGVVGSPVSDSDRAALRPETARVAVVAFLPIGTLRAEAGEVAQKIEESFRRHFQPSACGREVVSADENA